MKTSKNITVYPNKNSAEIHRSKRTRKKKLLVCYAIIIIGFLLLSAIIINKLITYNKSHSVTKIAYCKVYSEKDGKLFLKQIPGTFDPEEYGTSVFFIAKPKIIDQLEATFQTSGC